MEANLNKYQKNVYSQFGEDGIVEEILNRIVGKVDLNRIVIEFGAWDGIYLSNAYNLIKNFSYKGVLIESDLKKYIDLKNNISGNHILINKRIGLNKGSLLDDILESYDLPEDVDVMSIDIDGLDYWIFDSLKNYKPKVIIIEFNPTIPLEVKWVQDRDYSINQGASASAINDLGLSKGYTAVAATKCNLILLKNELLESADLKGISSDISNVIAEDEIKKIYIFSTYDGKIFTSSEINMPWHGIKISKDFLQVLPKMLRYYPEGNSGLRYIYFKLFKYFNRNKLINLM